MGVLDPEECFDGRGCVQVELVVVLRPVGSLDKRKWSGLVMGEFVAEGAEDLGLEKGAVAEGMGVHFRII